MATVSKNSAYPATVKAGIPRLLPCPELWTQAPIGMFLEVVKRPIKMDDDGNYDLVTVKRARGGAVKRETKLGREISVKSQFEVHENDFLISKRQIVHGACAIVPPDLEGSIVSNEYSVLATKPNLETKFFKYLSHSGYFQRTCFHSSIGVHIEKMIFKLDNWLKWKFNIPPVNEQRQIVEILSTWDQAIRTTENLIENSERQKKALMQQLLTGKKRLKGFSGDWKKYRLGEIAHFDTGYAFKSKEFTSEGSARIIRMSDLKEGNLKSFDFCLLPSSKVQGLERFRVSVGDFLFGMSGSLSNYAWVNTEDKPLYLNQRVGRIRGRNGFSPRFAQYLYLSKKVQSRILSLAAGAAQLNISLRDLRNIVVEIPDENEQFAIVKNLDVASDIITYNEKKLAHLKQEKAALMQQLLTGKRRVKIDEEIAA